MSLISLYIYWILKELIFCILNVQSTANDNSEEEIREVCKQKNL